MSDGDAYTPKHLSSPAQSARGGRRRVFAIVGIAVMLLLIAPAVAVLFTNVLGGDSTPATTSPPTTSASATTEPEGPPPHQVARATADEIEVFDQPADPEPARVVARTDVSSVEDHPIVFLVVAVAEVPGWLEVHLPVAVDAPGPGVDVLDPSKGFVRAGDVQVVEHRHRIEIDRTAEELRIFEGDTLLATQPVIAGCQDLLPPGAAHFVKESVHFSDANQTYQAFVLGLSGFPSVQSLTDAGQELVGIKGVSGSLVPGEAGPQACIHLRDEVIGQLITFDPLGTPVMIVSDQSDAADETEGEG